MTSFTTVDQAGDVGRGTSLAIGPDRRRHITYIDDTNENLKYATCADNCSSAGAWTKGVVDQAGDVGPGSSLRIGPNGRRYVTYWDMDNLRLKFATCDPASTCSTPVDWTKTIVDPDGLGSAHSVLVLNQDGAKEVVYRGGSTGDPELRYAVCQTDCGQAVNWFRVIVDQTDIDAGGTRSSFAIGGDGRRHVTYYGDGELKYATCASSCTSALNWQKSRIDIDQTGLHSSLVLAGPFGLRHVAYYDQAKGDLRYARCGADCTGARNWAKVTVASSGDVGVYPSLAVEPNNRVHVSYYHRTGVALLYATCAANCLTASGWTRLALDGVFAAAGEYPSLAVRDGVAEISYYDATNKNLRFLRRTP